jgi:two-component system, chemotaxis family, chemotaxis protein CheY
MQRIMVVDDSPTVRVLLKFALAGSGYQVLEASDGHGALAALAQMEAGEVAMMITDLNMPGLDGIELIRKVRSHPAHRLLPIVLLTGADAVKVREGHQAGASAWICKPFNVQQILTAVQQLLGGDGYLFLDAEA